MGDCNAILPILKRTDNNKYLAMLLRKSKTRIVEANAEGEDSQPSEPSATVQKYPIPTTQFSGIDESAVDKTKDTCGRSSPHAKAEDATTLEVFFQLWKIQNQKAQNAMQYGHAAAAENTTKWDPSAYRRHIAGIRRHIARIQQDEDEQTKTRASKRRRRGSQTHAGREDEDEQTPVDTPAQVFPYPGAAYFYGDAQGRPNIFVCQQNPTDPCSIVKVKVACKAPAGFAPTKPFKIVEGVAQLHNAINIVIDNTNSESFDRWQFLKGANLTFGKFRVFGAEVIRTTLVGSPLPDAAGDGGSLERPTWSAPDWIAPA